MHRRRSASHAAVAAAALAIAAPLLTGCGSEPRAGAAAVVGGERITVSQVQARTEAVRDAQRAGDDGDELIRSSGRLNLFNLNEMISARVIERAAADEGVSVSRREVQEARATDEKRARGEGRDLKQELLRENGLAPGQIDDSYRTRLLFNKLVKAVGAEQGEQNLDKAVRAKLVETSKKMGIKVSPRYGSWDTENFQLADGERSWLKARVEQEQPRPEGHGPEDGHDHG